MKIYRSLSLLTLAMMSVYMTGCATTHPTQQTFVGQAKSKASSFDYPKTRLHQDQQDHLLSGEYGRPEGFVGAQVASDPLRPDDGIDHYIGETLVDEYRWLENIDPIDPNYRYEADVNRTRNVIGSRLENPLHDGQFDEHTQQALAKVAPKTQSEIDAWVDAQNKMSGEYIRSLPIYEQVTKNIQSFTARRHRYQYFDTKVGEIEYIKDIDGHDRIIYTDLQGNTKTIFDQKLSLQKGDGFARRHQIYPSDTGKYVAYYLASGNADSDSAVLHVVDTTTGKDVITPINHVGRWDYVADITWDGDHSFFYVCEANDWSANLCRYDIGKNRFNQKIEVSGQDSEYLWLESASFVGEEDDDQRYIVLEGFSWRPTFYIKDRKKNRTYRIHDERFKNRIRAKGYENFQADVLAKLVHFEPKTREVWFWSTADSPRGAIYKTTLDNSNERELIIHTPPQFDKITEAIYHDEGEGYFVVSYLQDAISKVVLMNKKGVILKDLTPQGYGVVSDLESYIVGKDSDKDKHKDKIVHEDQKQNYISFRFQDPKTPRTIYKYSIDKDAFIDIRRRDLYDFDSDSYEVKHITYHSKDGTKLPMVITHKKGIKLDGKNPTLLYGYGGFGVDVDAHFDRRFATWLEQGGVYAISFIRGGGEYGSKWAADGQLEHKMKGFEDFEAAADYLSAQGYGDSEHLAIYGESNGGLLVGAAMVLNPNKYRVALPVVGVMDMLRHNRNYHTQYWHDAAYGDADDSQAMFNIIKSYSPYDNLKPDTCYPSTFAYTSKRDDRVSPANTFKFTARLQKVQSCDRPAMMYAGEHHGHHPYSPEDSLNQFSLISTFALHEMGVRQVPDMTNRRPPEFFKTDKWRQEEALEEAKRQADRQKNQQEKLKDGQSPDTQK